MWVPSLHRDQAPLTPPDQTLRAVSNGQLGGFPRSGERPPAEGGDWPLAPGQDKVAQTAELQFRAAGTMVAAPGGSARPEDPGPVVWPLVRGRAQEDSELDRACSFCPS